MSSSTTRELPRLGPLEAFSVEQVQAIFDTNVFGPLRLDKAVLPGMRARGSGLLIYVSSALGRVLPGIGGPYSASKWALEGLAEGLGNQIATFGIDVVLIEPGSYPSEALAKGAAPADQDVVADYARRGAGRRLRCTAIRRPTSRKSPMPPSRSSRRPRVTGPRAWWSGRCLTAGVADYNDRYRELKAALIAARRLPQ